MNEVNKVSYAGIYLALSVILIFFQIPIPTAWGGIAIDLGLVPVIISRRHLNNQCAIIIALIYPWFTLLGYIGGAIVGVLTLILISLMFILMDFLFEKITKNFNNCPKKYSFSKMWIWHYWAALIISFVLLVFNLFLFWPIYLFGVAPWGEGWLPPTLFNGYFGLIFAITMGTTIIRYCIVYLVISFIYPKIYYYF